MKYLKLSMAILGLFAFTQSYSQEVDTKVKKKFAKIDSNNDEALSLEEMAAHFEGKTNKKGKAYNVTKMFANKDADEDGKLSLEEYAAKGKKKGKKK